MLGISFDIYRTDIPEVQDPNEGPSAYVERLAREKAAAGLAGNQGRWVIAGDTVVAFDDMVLEKPTSADDAERMLLSMAGRVHTVFSGLAVTDPQGGVHSRVDRADVRFRAFDSGIARQYVETGEPMDKAGAYGIQDDLGALLVARLDGEYTNVVGLPLRRLYETLQIHFSDLLA